MRSISCLPIDDPSALEILLILNYSKDLWCAQTIDNIMKSNTSQFTGQKRTPPASIACVDRDSDCAFVSDWWHRNLLIMLS